MISQELMKDLWSVAVRLCRETDASVRGKNGEHSYTPDSVVRLLLEMLSPHSGRVYDRCCGSGSMLVQSQRFVQAHGGAWILRSAGMNSSKRKRK